MKFQIEFKKKTFIPTAIAFFIMLGFCLYSGKTPLMAVLFGAIYFAIKNITVTLTPKLNGLWVALEVIVCSLFTELLIHHMLLLPEDRVRITKEKWILNLLCCLVAYLVMICITARPKIACMITYIVLMSLAGINYFVYKFRGNEFSFNDFKAIFTGLSVASEYKFTLDTRAAMAVVLSIVFVAAIRKINLEFKRIYMLRGTTLCVAVISIVYLVGKTEYIVTETWEQKGSYRNGYILNFVLGIRDSFVEKPEGYSVDTIKMLEDQYGVTETDANTQASEEAPVIIAIMNESFADLGVIGNLQTNEPVTPFLDSMQTNITKGYALSSVFGAKTPNSEWEFLTGNTMAYLPSGSVAYQQYVSEGAYSLVGTLKNQGYQCIAMHPYYSTGWSRNKIYPLLGFEESYFMDDFNQNHIVREYITDQELYDKIIAQYEAKKKGDKMFIMSITMQNHGGYNDKYDNFTENIRMTNGYYPDVNQYLSLVNTSDAALQNLIHYFSNVDEKVEIVFFGDHQPSLNNNFYVSLNGNGLSGLTLEQLEDLFTVPFFIWTNYETETTTDVHTSLNYLSTMVLDKAGIELPPYEKFLCDMQKDIPAMNARGYYSAKDGCFKHYQDADGEEAEMLNYYQILQYNSMFDKRHKSEVFFSEE
ncbi:sulfatase-like hydrolase/transferase [Roseburia hominis]|uniref:alkaline phosphatase family protein n=1 Tax=Roseburia hominis TaxID=301301 RepID=UPI001F33F541|nr:sulfatase-like hydrolase/transferase [Roseburia hominis]